MSAIKTRISYTNSTPLDLSVIIVNYNVKYFLEQCLFSVIKASANIQAEIFVVDNNSTDGSKEYLETKFPRVIFKWNKSNDGFAKANNSVLAEVKGTHVLFLNPDTIIPEDCFEKCLSFFGENKDCAAMGVRMVDGAGKFLRESKRSFPSPATSFYKMSGLASLFPSSTLFSKYYAGHLHEKQNNEVDVLAGAYMMIRKPVLDKLNGFDENYFMYGEDIDLSYRIQQAGYKNYYFAGTTIVHFKGESTQKNSYRYIHTFYNAMNKFVTKHYKEKKATLLLMNASIGLSKTLSTSRLFLRNMISTEPNVSRPLQTAVVAGQQKFDKVLHLIRHSKVPLMINGRIAPGENDRGIALGTLEDIDQVIKRTKLNQLVFCEGELSFKTIIEKLEQLGSKVSCLFHSKSSSSIVGSNNKNDKGIFIAES